MLGLSIDHLSYGYLFIRSFINFVTLQLFLLHIAVFQDLILFFYFSDDIHTLLIFTFSSAHSEGLINEEWLSVDYFTAFTHFIAVHASCCPASFLNSTIILMAPAQSVAFCDSPVVSPMVEYSEYISILYLCTGVFLLKCIALHLFPFSFVFLIQKHFSNWSKHILIFLLLSKVLVTSLWIVVIIRLYNDAIFYSDHWFNMKLHRPYGQSLQNIRKCQLKITLKSLKNVLFLKLWAI